MNNQASPAPEHSLTREKSSACQWFRLAGLLYALFLLIPSIVFASSGNTHSWYELDKNAQPLIHLYFFWSDTCPHCLRAQPDIAELDKTYPWLIVHSLELNRHPDNVKTFIELAVKTGGSSRSVPSFLFCGKQISGYDSRQTTGKWLKASLLACYQYVREHRPDNISEFALESIAPEFIDLPVLGSISPDAYSLPALTVLIAGMDAFNPCAFFVLLFLLSLIAHNNSRGKMALVGGIFVFFSGAMYFLFMAAWLNLFIYLGELKLITILAGSLAILIALINIKDYFWFKKGVSLSISEGNKPRIFDRMRNLLRLESTATVAFTAMILAIVANSYELLCTAGFPMVYTRILTLSSLSSEAYYLYLLLYNLIYIIPLLLIVVLFTIKLGSRKLTEHEGRVLKLLSGNMMLLLGVLLVVNPSWLNNVLVALLIIVSAVIATWAIVKTGSSTRG